MNSRRNSRIIYTVLMALSLVLLAYSYLCPRQTSGLSYYTRNIERNLEKRCSLLDEYAYKALDAPAEELFNFSKMPSDFILYRYDNNHLSSWKGQLPVQYDEYIGRLRKSTLSKVGEDYGFYQFSSSSYLLRCIQKGDVKVIAALSLDASKSLRLAENTYFRSLHYTDGQQISVRGTPLFKIEYNGIPLNSSIPAQSVWLAYLLFVAAVLVSLHFHPKVKNAVASTTILMFFAWAVYHKYPVISGELTQIISILILSVASLIIATSLFIVRRDLWKKIKSPAGMVSGSAAVLVYIAFLVWFAYISIYKILVYTHINLDLYKIWALNLNTVVVYVALFMVFISIAMIFDLLQPVWVRLIHRRVRIFSVAGAILYSVFVAVFCVGFTADIGFQRERIMVASWAETLSNVRDYDLESSLRRVERQIAQDELVSHAPEGPEELAIARSRIIDRYLGRYLNSYDITVNAGSGKIISSGDEGVQIEAGSRFRYAPFKDQKCRYVALFQYYHSDRGQELVEVILEPKYPNKHSLSRMLDSFSSSDIPARYAYAMYKGGERQYFRGDLAYPMRFDIPENQKDTEYYYRAKGYLNFVIPVGEDELIIISRPYVSPGTFVIYAMFFVLLFCFMLAPFVRYKRKTILFEKNYFKRKLNILLVGSLLVCMSVLAFVSVSFVYDRNYFVSERMMSDKVNSLRFQIQNGLRNISYSSELTSRETMDLIRRVSDNSASDIALYRPDGKLAMTTAPNLYEKKIWGYRMDETPYYHLKYLNEGFCIHSKKMQKRELYMLYAPIMGASGEIVAFFASPYTETGNDFQFDALMHAFNVIIVFIVLALISTIAVSAIIDKTFRPLSLMSRKMRSGKIEKLDNIGYTKDDEIMDIIRSYNRMVDDLTNSSHALAQAERDKAWSEMARNVAHEIKNPLTPMQLQIQRVQRLKANGDPAWEEKFDNMAVVLLDHIHVLTETANQFSDFAKLYSEEPVRVNLDDLLREEVALYDNRPGVEFIYLGLPGVEVSAPRPQLVRVFVNLLNNAVQACEGRDDAQVAVSLRNGASADFYEIVFEDNGPGVDSQNEEKLFTPKFTTKSSGSGLGLSICKSILERCGASISYSRSFKLGGACFTILYPKSASVNS